MDQLGEPGRETEPRCFELGDELVPEDRYVDWEIARVYSSIFDVSEGRFGLKPKVKGKDPPLLRSFSILVTLAMGPSDGMSESGIQLGANLARRPNTEVRAMIGLLMDAGHVVRLEPDEGTELEESVRKIKYGLSEEARVFTEALHPPTENKSKLKKSKRVAKAIARLQPSND